MQFDKDTIALLLQTIKKYGWMDLPSYGMTMYPFIKKGNICRFVEVDPNTIKKGDVLLYHSTSGQLVAHRFCRVSKINNENKYVLKGDLNICIDEPINKGQIIGRLVTVDSNKKKVYMDDLTAILWGIIITNFPILSKMLKKYLSFKTSFTVSNLKVILFALMSKR